MKYTVTIDTDLVQIVPKLPTQKMLDACSNGYDAYNKLNYAQMLEAAPEVVRGENK